jgi:hypothetical protein
MIDLQKPALVLYKSAVPYCLKNGAEPTSAQWDRFVRTKEKASVIESYNYENKPGNHTQFSPIVGIRFKEYLAVRNSLINEPAAYAFEIAIYCDPSLIFLLPVEKKEQIDALAEKMLLNKINGYSDDRITIKNAIRWTNKGSNIPSNCFRIIPATKKIPWHITAAVKVNDDIENDKYLPKDLIACHELDHVEESPVFAKTTLYYLELRELMTRMRSLFLLDEIYRQVHSLDMKEKVTYNKPIQWGHNCVELGDLISFFRGLEIKYGSLAKAYLSKEALLYMKTGGRSLILPS